MRIQQLHIKGNDRFPNNERLPVLLYVKVLDIPTLFLPAR